MSKPNKRLREKVKQAVKKIEEDERDRHDTKSADRRILSANK